MAQDGKKAKLTNELLERLSKEGYCFDIEHEKEINKIRDEVAAAQASKEAAIKEAVDKVKEEYEAKIERLNTLLEEQNRLMDETKEICESTNKQLLEAQKKLDTVLADLQGKAKESELCFKKAHKLLDDKKYFVMGVETLVLFSAYTCYSNGPEAKLPVMVVVENGFQRHFDRASMDMNSLKSQGNRILFGDDYKVRFKEALTKIISSKV